VALIPSIEKANKAVSAFDAAATLLEQNQFDRSCEVFLKSQIHKTLWRGWRS
jgi:hypothetical protein